MSRNNVQTAQSRMALPKVFASAVISLSLLSVPLTSWSQDTADTVKKSESGICHDASSRHYERVKSFKSYKSMQACLDDGGRKPKK